MCNERVLYSVRVALVVSLIFTIGIFLAYPRYNGDADIPAPFSNIAKEMLGKADQFAKQSEESRERLKRLKSFGRALDTHKTLEERMIEDRKLKQKKMSEQLKEQGIVTDIDDLSADKQTLLAISGANHAGNTGQDTVDQDRSTILLVEKIMETIDRNLRIGVIKDKQAEVYWYMTEVAIRNSGEGLTQIIDSLQTPESLKKAVYTKFALPPKVVIGSSDAKRTAGSLIASDQKAIIDFEMENDMLPASVSVEARRYRLAHSPFLRIFWLTAALSSAILLQVEHSLNRKQAKYCSNLSAADASRPVLITVGRVLIVLSVVSVIAFTLYGHPVVPYPDNRLQRYLVEQIEAGVFAVYPYIDSMTS